MPDYRRAYMPGGTFFFTVVTANRSPLFQDARAVSLFGACLRECRRRWPFQIPAIVVLPDHLHTVWSLPAADTNYSQRWGWIKKEFTGRWLALGRTESKLSTARRREGRRGVWQPRFWEHTISDDEDFELHFDYIHYNPVKHGWVTRVADWPHSSFHRWVRAGVYPASWADGDALAIAQSLSKMDDRTGECADSS